MEEGKVNKIFNKKIQNNIQEEDFDVGIEKDVCIGEIYDFEKNK